VDNLNGDKYATGKTTPDGLPDPSVFSTEGDPVGIQVGTAIATMVRRAVRSSPVSRCATGEVGERSEPGGGSGRSEAPSGLRPPPPLASQMGEDPVETSVRYRDLWGTAKRRDLLRSLQDPELEAKYTRLAPDLRLGYPFKPRTVEEAYLSWVPATDLFRESHSGIKTARDSLLVDIERQALETRMQGYFDPSLPHDSLARTCPVALIDTVGFDADRTREKLQSQGIGSGSVLPYDYRPFDRRWLYWERSTKLLDRNRAEYVDALPTLCPQIVLAQRTRKGFDPPLCVTALGSYHLIESVSLIFPLRLNPPEAEHLFAAALSDEDRARTAWNLSERAWAGLEGLGIDDPSVVFYHVLATLHSPAYREANAGALRQDWPRVPWPSLPSLSLARGREQGEGEPAADAPGTEAMRAALEASAELGRRVAALLDPETPVPGITTGALEPALRRIAVWTILDGSPPMASDFEVTAHWGYRGQGGVVMPATGRLMGGVPDPESPLGPETVDVALNDRAVWRGVPQAVWEYKLGGYQVLKKWLSYREKDVLGRPLTPEEIRHFTATARRIATLLALGPELDAAHVASAQRCATESPTA